MIKCTGALKRMARAGDGNNLRPQAAMNMHHFAIPLPRPLAPGQNVTIRFVQAGAPGVQHAHFHFAMQGQAASPVLRDSQGPEAQEGKAKSDEARSSYCKMCVSMQRSLEVTPESRRKTSLRCVITHILNYKLHRLRIADFRSCHNLCLQQFPCYGVVWLVDVVC